MRLVFTPEADHQATEMDTWWRERRPGARGLFARELAEVRALLTSTPSIGVVYTTQSGRPTRRVLMPKTRNYVFYEVREDEELVVVLAVWGAPRGEGPKL